MSASAFAGSVDGDTSAVFPGRISAILLNAALELAFAVPQVAHPGLGVALIVDDSLAVLPVGTLPPLFGDGGGIVTAKHVITSHSLQFLSLKVNLTQIRAYKVQQPITDGCGV